MVLDLSFPKINLVSLLEIEVGYRIDEDGWTGGSEYYCYVADTANHRIKKHKCSDLSYVNKFGSFGAGNDQFNQPRGICTDGTHLYICDTVNHRIKKHKVSDFSFVSEVGSQGSGDDQFDNPYGICTDGTYLYIGDTDNNRIVKRKCSDLSYVSKIGSWGSGDDQFGYPNAICTDNIHLYICDRWNNRIVKRKCSDLSYDSKFGTFGYGDDNFNYPWGICTDNTHIYVSDSGNHRIKKHKCSDLSYVSKIGSQGTGDDQFLYPADSCTDNTHIYICDGGRLPIGSNDRVKKHKCSDLSYVSKIGSAGSGNDQFNYPWGGEYSQEGNSWYISHPEGEPSKVEQCLRSTLEITVYTERASLVLCDANPSSWYWDAANNRLYLHTSGSDDPSTVGKYLIQSYFWEYFCNKQAGDIIFGGHFYLPYLDDTIPSITVETSGYHEGGTRQTFGEISIINADGYFDTRLSDYIYEAKKIRYLVGRKGDVYGDYITFWIGWTGNISWSDAYVKIGIDDLRKCREY